MMDTSQISTIGSIIVDSAKAIREAEKMANIANEIRGRSLTVQFTKSKGKTVDAIYALAAALEEYGDAYASLVEKCSQAVRCGGVEFAASDQNASGLFMKEG